MPDIFPLTYRKGREFWHIYTRQGAKVAMINISLDGQEQIARIMTEGANQHQGVKG